MESLTFQELRDKNLARCKEVFYDIDKWDVNDWATALGGEFGEALEIMGKLLTFLNTAKKLKRLDDADSSEDTFEKRQELLHQLGNELADVVIYADLTATKCALRLEMFIVSKFNEVSGKRGSSIYL